MSNTVMARKLGVSEGTIRYRLKKASRNELDGRKRKVSGVSAFSEAIDTWIEGNAALPKRNPIWLLYEALVRHHSYPLSYDSLRRYIARRYPEFMGKRKCLRLETPPGKLAQIDWKEDVPVRIGAYENIVAISFFVLVLAFSRKPVVVVSEKRDCASFLHCHTEAYRKLGGLTEWVRPDCVSTAVVRWKGSKTVLTDAYGRFLDSLKVSAFPSRPRTATDKGKVEKRIQDIFVRMDLTNRVFADMADLQKAMDETIESLCGTWRCGATGLNVKASAEYEKGFLKPLPERLPSISICEKRTQVRNDGTVFFLGNSYQVQELHIGSGVLCVHSGTKIRIYRDGMVVAEFPYLPGTKGMVFMNEKAIEESRRPMSDIVRGWAIEVARRQIEYYESSIGSAR